MKELAEKIQQTKAAIKVANDKLSDLKLELSDLESEMISKMDELGVDSLKTDAGSFSISETGVANADDWEAFWDYVHEHHAGHLVQRRLATTAIREALEAGHEIPGVSIFKKRGLNSRKPTKR